MRIVRKVKPAEGKARICGQKAQHRRLTDDHLKHLKESGLSVPTIRKAQLYSASRTEVTTLLGFDAGPGLVFPYRTEKGYARVRLDVSGSDGKRYRSPKGARNHLYIPDIFDTSLLRDVTKPLYITEGEKKALKGCQEGLPVIGLSGVWTWRATVNDRTVPLPELDEITWRGRDIYVVFDSDINENDEVKKAEEALAEELAKRGATVHGVRLPDGRDDEKVGLDDYLVTHSTKEFFAVETITLAEPPALLGSTGIDFLTQAFPPSEVFVESLLSSDGGGWIGGEEKLGKTFYALEEALCLGLQLPVCDRFAVPKPRRVLFIEEEDPPQRVQARINALLVGHGINPRRPEVKRKIEEQIRIAVWEGFSLDREDMLARLEATLADFRPEVVYLDALRKLTRKNLNMANEAGEVLEKLDVLRRRYGVLFRVVHHYRKATMGYRTARGSQELGGSYVLGAWGENSLFFEPNGKNSGKVRVQLQTKDGANTPAFSFMIESEGDIGKSTKIRLRLEENGGESTDVALEEQIYQALSTLEKTEPLSGKGVPGVTIQTICKYLKRRADKPIRLALSTLKKENRVKEVGTGLHNIGLWDIAA